MKGISARTYLNLNVHLAVLCRNTIMPSKPPGQPPSAPNITRIDSDTRQPDRCALHLSNPNTRNVAALIGANQMAANESWIFKRGLVFSILLPDWRVNSPKQIGCLAGNRTRTSGVRDRRTAGYATRQWSPGKVLPPRLLGVGQTLFYFAPGRSKLDLPKLAASP